MRTESFFFEGSGKAILPAMLWLPDDQPRLILQVAHGMTEHMGRYLPFAQTMTAQGIAVAGFDLRGHGQNPGNSSIASFGQGGWEASIEDIRQFHLHLRSRFPEVPQVMLGFSLGSFLLREYLGQYPDGIHGAVIMGTGHQPGWLLSIMEAIVKTQFGKDGFDGTTDLVRDLSFGSYNQKFKPNKTMADWLCADEAQLQAYLKDPLVRRDISAGLFWQLLGSMKRTGRLSSYKNWKKDLPLLLLSGQDDPVGDLGKGVQAVQRQMEAAGCKNVTLVLIPQARHDLLHECGTGAAATARELLIQWLEKSECL